MDDIPGYSGLELVGAGGSGVVYSARDERHSRDVAIKILTGQSIDPSIQESFSREIQAMGALSDHPNIVTLYDSGFVGDRQEPYMVMPLFTRGSFASRFNDIGASTNDQIVDIATKLLAALGAAHDRNILHRDIKPENTFVGNFNDEPILGDFGISTLLGSGKTTTKAMAYTLTYAAPEVLNGVKQTVASDLYSLGTTLFTISAGVPPHSAENTTGLITKILTQDPDALPDLIEPPLRGVIESMMQRDPADRPKTCRDALEMLERHPSESTPSDPPSSDPTPAAIAWPDATPSNNPSDDGADFVVVPTESAPPSPAHVAAPETSAPQTPTAQTTNIQQIATPGSEQPTVAQSHAPWGQPSHLASLNAPYSTAGPTESEGVPLTKLLLLVPIAVVMAAVIAAVSFVASEGEADQASADRVSEDQAGEDSTPEQTDAGAAPTVVDEETPVTVPDVSDAAGSQFGADFDPSVVADEPYRIGISLQQQRAFFWIAVANGAVDAASILGAGQLEFFDADGSIEQQDDDIDFLIINDVDGIVLGPTNSVEAESMVQRANSAGIPTMVVALQVGDPAITGIHAVHPDTVGLVTNDDIEMGTVAAGLAQEATKNVNAPINIAILEGTPGTQNTRSRDEGFVLGLENLGVDYTIVAASSGNFRREDAAVACEDMLAESRSIDVIYSHSDEMTIGCVTAIQASGQSIPIVSIGGNAAGIDLIEDGAVYGTVCQKPATMGALATQLLIEHLNGAPASTEPFFYQTPAITINNLEDCVPEW